jgi:hypothetical protein
MVSCWSRGWWWRLHWSYWCGSWHHLFWNCWWWWWWPVDAKLLCNNSFGWWCKGSWVAPRWNYNLAPLLSQSCPLLSCCQLKTVKLCFKLLQFHFLLLLLKPFHPPLQISFQPAYTPDIRAAGTAAAATTADASSQKLLQCLLCLL